MNKKKYILPETVVHEMEIQSVLHTVSLDKVETSSENTEDFDDSDKAKGFNINLWN